MNNFYAKLDLLSTDLQEGLETMPWRVRGYAREGL
jgi:hypothetical protein